VSPGVTSATHENLMIEAERASFGTKNEPNEQLITQKLMKTNFAEFRSESEMLDC